MSVSSFHHLVNILDIHVNEARSRASTGGNAPITSTMIVAIGVRYLGGEKRKSLADIFGTSDSSIDRVIDKFLNAVNDCTHPHLSTDLLPVTEEAQTNTPREWKAGSHSFGDFLGVYQLLMDGCAPQRNQRM